MQLSSILQSNTSSAAANTATGASSTKAKDAAKAFEALFTSMMMRSMRSASSPLESTLLPKSMSEKIYTEMLDEQYGNLLSKHGSLGLAELILKQLGGSGNSEAALAMLKGLKNSSPILNEKEFLPSQQTAAQTIGGVSQWQPFITEASEKFGVDSALISAVIAQESGGNSSAVSSKGAKGLMQLMDSTAKDMGVTKVFQPRQNILGGTRYLRQLLDKYNGDETQALASYNAGPAAVDKYNGVPPYPETQQYINKVTSLKKQFSSTPLTKEAAHE